MLSGVSVTLVAAVMIVVVVDEVVGEAGSSGFSALASVGSASTSVERVGREEEGVWGSLMGASDASLGAAVDVDLDGAMDEEEWSAEGGSGVGDASVGSSSITSVVVWTGCEGALEPVKSNASSSSLVVTVVP